MISPTFTSVASVLPISSLFSLVSVVLSDSVSCDFELTSLEISSVVLDDEATSLTDEAELFDTTDEFSLLPALHAENPDSITAVIAHAAKRFQFLLILISF